MAAGGAAAAAVAVGVVVWSGAGHSQAQAPSPTATPAARGQGQQQRQQMADDFLNTLAANLSGSTHTTITADMLRDALKQTALQEVDKAVQSGRLTDAQAQKLRDAINSGNPGALGLGLGRFGMGGHGPGMNVRRVDDQALAGFFGITPEQLRQDLQSGKSLADEAAAHGKSVDDLKNFIVNQASQRINQAVSDGHLTQQQADTILNNLKSHLDDMINRAHTGGPGGLRPRGR
jgi:hypothetical protein